MRARNKGIEIRPEIRQDPEIYAVAGEIRQLIANLLNNSIDAVGSGGLIRIRVDANRLNGQQSAWSTDYHRRFWARHSADRTVEAFRAVFHHQERRGNGPGALGLHEHRAETPWIDSREEQHDSRAELDVFSVFLPAGRNR